MDAWPDEYEAPEWLGVVPGAPWIEPPWEDNCDREIRGTTRGIPWIELDE